MALSRSRFRFLSALFVAVVFGLASASEVASAEKQGEIHVATKSGQHKLSVEWAVTPSEREHGLMGRETMAPNHGMLFDFGSEQPLYFWMKNTPLSLDMIFIKADGRTSHIERATTPFSEDLIPGGEPARYVLELVAGSAERLALAPGDRFAIPRH
ncbi:MAG: DUF192 domain-containing protein [Candidatus Kaistia colombiensis]|nr:MAG: DUF192 domain-containing protein [Kaistia sp.]